MSRTPLFARKQPGGVFTIVDYPTHTGSVWFVDSNSTTGADSVGYGQNPDAPCLTVDYAIGLAAAGDTIYVAEGHNEGSASVIFDADVAGLKIIGCGVGSRRPTFDYDNAAATIDVGASNVTLRNLIFRPSVTAVLVGVDIEANFTGVHVENCEWAIGEDGAGTDEFVKGLVLNSANHDTVIRDCTFLSHASAGQSTHAIHIVAASDRLTLERVVIDGPWATGGLVEAAAGVNHITRWSNADTTGTNWSWHGASTFAERRGELDAGAESDTGLNLIGVNDANNVADTSNVVANRDGSVLERMEHLLDCVLDDETTNAIGVNDADNAFVSSSVVANRDGSILERLEDCEDLQPRVAKKAAAVISNGLTLFTIAGGPIIIDGLVSICETLNDATASTLQYNVTPTTGSAQTISGASGSLANAAAGASVTLAGTALSTAALYNANGPNLIANPGTIMAPIGTITAVVGVGSTTGTWAHYLRYRPLAAGVTVS